MGAKAIPEMGNVKCANCAGLMAQDDLRLSPSEYGEAQVGARRTAVTCLNMGERARNSEAPGRRPEDGERPGKFCLCHIFPTLYILTDYM
jgi:hypothetical protein